jgi:hypothetical protein
VLTGCLGCGVGRVWCSLEGVDFVLFGFWNSAAQLFLLCVISVVVGFFWVLVFAFGLILNRVLRFCFSFHNVFVVCC